MSEKNPKIEELKEKGKEFYEKAKEKAKENKEVLVVFGPCVVGAAVEIMKSVSRNSTMRENRRLKERMVYDRKSGHYYETKKKMRNRDWMEFDERRSHGEPVGEILKDMGLLKK